MAQPGFRFKFSKSNRLTGRVGGGKGVDEGPVRILAFVLFSTAAGL
jgi:hypothetical protein